VPAARRPGRQSVPRHAWRALLPPSGRRRNAPVHSSTIQPLRTSLASPTARAFPQKRGIAALAGTDRTLAAFARAIRAEEPKEDCNDDKGKAHGGGARNRAAGWNGRCGARRSGIGHQQCERALRTGHAILGRGTVATRPTGRGRGLPVRLVLRRKAGTGRVGVGTLSRADAHPGTPADLFQLRFRPPADPSGLASRPAMDMGCAGSAAPVVERPRAPAASRRHAPPAPR
jgi:hypothetical protein